jgi:hypothetical protein
MRFIQSHVIQSDVKKIKKTKNETTNTAPKKRRRSASQIARSKARLKALKERKAATAPSEI